MQMKEMFSLKVVMMSIICAPFTELGYALLGIFSLNTAGVPLI